MGKNPFEKAITSSLKSERNKEINYKRIKESRLNQNPFEMASGMNDFDDLIPPTPKNENRCVKSVSLYEEDLNKMKFISSKTGASLSKFIRSKINEEYQKLKNGK